MAVSALAGTSCAHAGAIAIAAADPSNAARNSGAEAIETFAIPISLMRESRGPAITGVRKMYYKLA
jgi:hypothetical protein